MAAYCWWSQVVRSAMSFLRSIDILHTEAHSLVCQTSATWHALGAGSQACCIGMVLCCLVHQLPEKIISDRLLS